MNIQYDSPCEIKNVNLTIQVLSHNTSPEVYANGRNQLPFEINATATDKYGEILKFSYDTWIKILSLCFSETDAKLTRKGTHGWCFTEAKNDYSKEVKEPGSSTKLQAPISSGYGSVTLTLYVYTDVQETSRISVCLDTAAGTPYNKHFTTADTAELPEQMSVQVTSLSSLDYKINDLKIDPAYRLNPTKATVNYNILSGCGSTGEYDAEFPCHYDNYYISLQNNNTIKNADMHGYGSVEGPYKWIAAYDSNYNNQHMIVVHPFNTGQQTEKFGFDNSASWDKHCLFWSSKGSATFHLTQNVTYNERANYICLTQMAFLAGQKWELPDNYGLNIKPFYFDSWVDFYDEYGNHGKFSVQFTDDQSFIKIVDR